MTTCELRLKAAEIIEERGHNKGHYCDNGLVCLLGALNVADGNAPDGVESSLVIDAVFEMGLRMAGRVPESRLVPWASEWNDAPERTKEEVLDRLRDGCEPVKVSAESAS